MAFNLTGVTPLFMVQTPPFTIEVPDIAVVHGETTPRRHPKAQDGLWERPAPDIYTTFDLLRRSADIYSNEPAVGSRTLIKIHKETTKVPRNEGGKVVQVDKDWTYFELSDYKYLTYLEYFTQALQVGSGLRKLGLQPKDKVHLFASTRFVMPAPVMVGLTACPLTSLTRSTASNGLAYPTQPPRSP